MREGPRGSGRLGGGGFCIDEGLGFAEGDLADEPVVVVVTEIVDFRPGLVLVHPGDCFGEDGAGSGGVSQLMLGHGEKNLGQRGSIVVSKFAASDGEPSGSLLESASPVLVDSLGGLEPRQEILRWAGFKRAVDQLTDEF